MRLREACQRYANPQDWNRYQELSIQLQERPHRLNWVTSHVSFDEVRTVNQGIRARRNFLEREWNDAKRRVLRPLIEALRNDRARAEGYQHPRTAASPLEPLPTDLWHTGTAINLNTSTVSADGLTFVGVRVYDSPAVVDKPSPESSYPQGTVSPPNPRPTTSRKKPGPRSQDGLLEEAYKQLYAERCIDFEGSASDHYNDIIARARQIGGLPKNARGFSTTTLKRVINPLFQRDQEARPKSPKS